MSLSKINGDIDDEAILWVTWIFEELSLRNNCKVEDMHGNS